MPLWKYAINRASTVLARWVLGARLTEFHCGFRVYRRRFVEAVNFRANSNGHLFSFQIIAQASRLGFKIAEVPVTCRYFQGATQIDFKSSAIYGWGVLKTLFYYLGSKLGKRHPLFLPHLQRSACQPTQ